MRGIISEGLNMTCVEAKWSRLGRSRRRARFVNTFQESPIVERVGVLARSLNISCLGIRRSGLKIWRRGLRAAAILRLVSSALSAIAALLVVLTAGLGQAHAEYWSAG